MNEIACAANVAEEIVNVCCAVGAAEKDELPAWLASTTHVPTPVKEIVAPFVPPLEHAPEVLAASIVKVTGLPDAPPVAATA